MATPGPLVGILVGGGSRRMGGRPKGLLDAGGGEPIVARLARLARTLGHEPVLVGDVTAYDHLGIRRIPDRIAGQGPLAGLVALLAEATGEDVVAVACDMPRIPEGLLRRVIALPAGTTAAPKHDGRWQPLLGRYSTATRALAEARLARGERSLVGLLEEARATVLALDAAEAAALVDWDRPEDIG